MIQRDELLAAADACVRGFRTNRTPPVHPRAAYPKADRCGDEPGALGDPMGPLSKASLPFDRNAKEQKAPDIMVGAAFVSELFAVSEGKIAEIHAFWTPSEGNVRTPWATGGVPVRDW